MKTGVIISTITTVTRIVIRIDTFAEIQARVFRARNFCLTIDSGESCWTIAYVTSHVRVVLASRVVQTRTRVTRNRCFAVVISESFSTVTNKVGVVVSVAAC